MKFNHLSPDEVKASCGGSARTRSGLRQCALLSHMIHPLLLSHSYWRSCPRLIEPTTGTGDHRPEPAAVCALAPSMARLFHEDHDKDR